MPPAKEAEPGERSVTGLLGSGVLLAGARGSLSAQALRVRTSAAAASARTIAMRRDSLNVNVMSRLSGEGPGQGRASE
jgi:hypothetical protein